MPASTLPAPGSVGHRQPEAAKRLVVAWQNPDPEDRAIEPIGLLSYDGHIYRFSYIQNALAVRGFQPLLGFDDFHELYSSERLFPLFAQRVMDPRRPDFQRYVTDLGFDGEPEPWEQIGRSQGRRRGDTLQLLPVPQVNDGDVLTYLFLVHGIRHLHEEPLYPAGREMHVSSDEVQAALDSLTEGRVLSLVPEPMNPVNPRAVLVVKPSSIPVGWVPNLLADDICRLIESGAVLRVTVARINGSDAPLHMRLLVQLTTVIPGGFRFFTGEKWKPLAAGFPQ